MLRGIWAAKTRDGKPYGKAHYLDENGRPACATLLAPFTCDWSALTHDDRHHLCTLCKRMRDPSKACRCGTCGVSSRSA